MSHQRSIALRGWHAAAAEFRAVNQASLDADVAALRTREDLCGMFGALQAKARNRGAGEEPALAALSSEVVELLARRPTPMARLAERVARYQEQLL